MGTSNWQNISYVVELIRAINPHKILDFGVGFGRWGILSREFLEIWDESNYSGIWNRQIDGVEVFQDYIKPYHQYFYNNIFIEEGYQWINNSKSNYDLIIFGDVLEHFEKQLALNIINKALILSGYVLINIPVGNNWEQSEKNCNKYEEHKSTWSTNDFNCYKNIIIKKFKDFIGRDFCVVLISSKPININEMLKKRYGKHFKIRNLIKYRFNLHKIIKLIARRKN